MIKFQKCKAVGAALFFVSMTVGFEAYAGLVNKVPQNSSVQRTAVDVFARSGSLIDPEAGKPVGVNGKALPASPSNLPPQANWTLEKSQCALYLKNDIMRFNKILKDRGESDEALQQAHMTLDSRIYLPALREGDDWAKTGKISAGECRKAALGVQRALRDYLKGSASANVSQQGVFNESAHAEHIAAVEGGGHFSELQRLKKAICQAFNPMIVASGGIAEEESIAPTTQEDVNEVAVVATPASVPAPVPQRASTRQRPSLRRSSSAASITPSTEETGAPVVRPVRARPSSLRRSQTTAALPVQSETPASPRVTRVSIDKETLRKGLAKAKDAGDIPQEDAGEEEQTGSVEGMLNIN